MRKANLAIIFLLLFISSAQSQSNFEINYGTADSDVGYAVQQTFDGKYIIAGTTVNGGNSDVYLALIDTNGILLWTKTYGGSMEDVAWDVRQTSDSGFVIAGSTNSFGNGYMDAYLIRTNNQGDTLWTKTYGGSNFDYGFAVQNTYDGGFIISGQESSTDSAGIAHIYMIRTNFTGDTLWTRSYPMSVWAGAIDIVTTADSGFVIYGDFQNLHPNGWADYDLVFMKTDSLGIPVWTKTFEDTLFDDLSQSIKKTYDGGFILVSHIENLFSPQYVTSRLVRINSVGDTLWTRIFGLNYDFNINDICQSPDSGFYITGNVYDTSFFTPGLFITKLNEAGDSLWTKYYNGLYSAIGNSITGTSDSGIIICGSTSDSTFTQSDIYVLKLDSTASLISCQHYIVSQSTNQSIYENDSISFYVSPSIQNVSFQWQTDSAGTFVNLVNGSVFSGVNTDSLLLSGVPLSLDGSIFRCIITDSAGCLKTSNQMLLTVNSSVEVSVALKSQFKIYPNPATTSIFIEGALPHRTELFDVFGKKINETMAINRINIAQLKNGFYILKVFSDINENATVFRFIKN